MLRIGERVKEGRKRYLSGCKSEVVGSQDQASSSVAQWLVAKGTLSFANSPIGKGKALVHPNPSHPALTLFSLVQIVHRLEYIYF
jgi:hypothetical protein